MATRAPNGFALVETLVASAIIAGMLGLTFQSIETAARQTRMVEQRRLAMLIAQSQMTAIGAAQSARFGEARGVTSGVAWQMTVQPYRAAVASAINLDLISVSARPVGGARDLVVLKTLRVSQ
jgi:type II secretory pathway pseudopilin PulG